MPVYCIKEKNEGVYNQASKIFKLRNKKGECMFMMSCRFLNSCSTEKIFLKEHDGN